jgi:Domain of unknown function (DUF4907)
MFMNFNLMLKTMTTIINRRQGMVLLTALSLAAGITMFKIARRNEDPDRVTSNCFKTTQGWGYDILVGKKIVIHQSFIPGVPGFQGFTTQQQAQAVAQIVIEKIKSHKQPFISHEQLQQLGIIYAPIKNE